VGTRLRPGFGALSDFSAVSAGGMERGDRPKTPLLDLTYLSFVNVSIWAPAVRSYSEWRGPTRL
jgi:hypothetical protein